MLTPITGRFISHNIEEKQGNTGPFLVGQMLVVIDNSYEPKGKPKVDKFANVPFKVIGETAKKAMSLEPEQDVSIQYELDGREYNGKHYSEVRAVFIEPGQKNAVHF